VGVYKSAVVLFTEEIDCGFLFFNSKARDAKEEKRDEMN
jgi:hypothetical protein